MFMLCGPANSLNCALQLKSISDMTAKLIKFQLVGNSAYAILLEGQWLVE